MFIVVAAGAILSEFSRTEIADGFGAKCVVQQAVEQGGGGVGDGLASAVESYVAAKNQLQTGRGNLISVAERMSKLGVETPKGGELAKLIESVDTGVEDAVVEAAVKPIDSRLAG